MIGTVDDFQSIICVTGHKGAGKDEFCKRMGERWYHASVRFSDPIRAEAVKQYGPSYTVEQLVEIGNEGRRQGGAGYWAERLMDFATENRWDCIVINGARNPAEIAMAASRSAPNFALVGITAPIMTRYARIAKRGQTEDRAQLEKFLAMDDTDRGLGQPEDGQQVDRCMAQVPRGCLYNNAGTLTEYHAWVDEVYTQILLDRIRTVPIP